jgi:hypothetical protein
MYAYGERRGLSFGTDLAGNTIYYWTGLGRPFSRSPSARIAVNQAIVYMFALDMDNQRRGPGKTAVALRGSLHGPGPRSSRDSMARSMLASRSMAAVSNTFRGNFMGPFTYPVPTGSRLACT